MSRPALFFLFTVSPLFAALLAFMGVQTLSTNPLGGFLAFVGLGYLAALLIYLILRRGRLSGSNLNQRLAAEETGDRSFWFVTVGMVGAFFIPPVEYLYFKQLLPQFPWLKAGGLVLMIAGMALFLWARRALGSSFSGHLSVTEGQRLVQTGPYRLIRHPAYAGYLMMAAGVSLGYSSLLGLAVILFFLLPGLLYRIKIEESYLEAVFGPLYKQYASRTHRLIPGLW